MIPLAGRLLGRLLWGLCFFLVLSPEVSAAPATPTALSPWEPFRALRAYSVATGQQGKRLRHTVTVAEDVYGRIWVGDYAGVSRLDGDVQRRFDGALVAEMAEGYTHAFYPLSGGDMLVGGDREGVLWFDHDTERFHPISAPSGERLTRINAFAPAQDGGVWVASEQGLFQWKSGSRTLQSDAPSGRELAASPRLFDVQQMPDGTLWVAAQPGLYRRLPGQTVWEPVTVDDPRLQARLRSESVWDLTADDHGRLWVGLMQSGVVVIDPSGKASAPSGLDGVTGLHQGRTIRSMLWDERYARLLVGTDGGGMLVVKDGKAARLPINLSDFTGGRNFHVRSIMRARNGQLWVASDRGVFHLDYQPGPVMELDSSLPGEDPNESPATVRALYVDRQGRLWMGQLGGVVQVLDPASGRRTVIRLPAPLDGNFITAITGDAHGHVWITGNGVVRVDGNTLMVRPAGEIGDRFPRRFVDIASDGQRLWLSHNEGLVEVDRHGRILRRMETTASGLRSTRLNALSYRDGRLWVGSAEGLHEVDLEHWTARPVPVAGQEFGQGIYRQITSIAVTGHGVWAGTLQGIVYGKAGDGRFQQKIVDGEREFRSLADDGQGGVWFAQDGRPSRFGQFRSDGSIRWLPPRQGLHPETIMHAKAMAVTPAGAVAVATDSGALLVDPLRVDHDDGLMPDLSPRVLEVRVDGKRLAAPTPDARMVPLRLGHDAERLEVGFSALDYIGQRFRHYSYRLEGLDTRWNPIDDAAPRVFYSRLPAGDYTLLLRTTSDEYPGREWVTHLPLLVAPAWYQNRWSWLLLAVGVSLLVWGSVQLRLRRAHRDQLLLQDMVSARTEQLQQANARLARLADEDALTGLLSRRAGLERLSERHALHRERAGEDAVILMDLDYFKQINDTFGHLAGDAVLREVATRLRGELRAMDVAVRYGGEELLLVLPLTSGQAGVAVAERLGEVLRDRPVAFDTQLISIRASFGVARLDGSQSIEEVLAAADKALYQAKSFGRDRVCAAPEPFSTPR